MNKNNDKSIDNLIDSILNSYNTYGGINRTEAENFPNRENVLAVLQNLESLIFPGFKSEENLTLSNIRYITGAKVNSIIAVLTREIEKSLIYTVQNRTGDSKLIQSSHCYKLAKDSSIALIEDLPEIKRLITLDLQAGYKGDPAAHSQEEIILSYPGLSAILVYRIAHFLYSIGIPIIPRIMSEYIHGKTGIDINPGASIGESFFIDHGTGVVIGETCSIGSNVKLYQGVTLGALSVEKHLENKKRHPTIESDVTIYSGATILGGDTVIGRGSTIGGNTWVVKSVPPYTKLFYNHHEVNSTNSSLFPEYVI